VDFQQAFLFSPPAVALVNVYTKGEVMRQEALEAILEFAKSVNATNEAQQRVNKAVLSALDGLTKIIEQMANDCLTRHPPFVKTDYERLPNKPRLLGE